MVEAEATKRGSCTRRSEEGSRGRDMDNPRCLLASKEH